MKVQISSYNDSTSTWNAEVEETKAISYRIQHNLDGPAEAWVKIRDSDGTKAQKYNDDDDDNYLGTSKIYIEDPDGTDVFYGRIVKVTAVVNAQDRYVELYCRDWLDQLDDERVDYDMREDLDGNGLRQSTVFTDANSAIYVGPIWNDSGGESGLYWMFDDAMAWSADDWNGYYVSWLAGAAGNRTIEYGPRDTTSTASTDAFNTDIGDLWVDDGNGHTTANGTSDYTTEYRFNKRIYSLTDYRLDSVNDITDVRVTFVYSLTSAGVEAKIQVHNGTDYKDIGFIEGTTDTIVKKETIQIPKEYIPDLFTATSYVKIRFNVVANSVTTNLKVHYAWLEVDATVSGVSVSYGIEDTEYNRIGVDEEIGITGVEIMEGDPYAISSLIYKHIDSGESGTLITDNDDIITLTCAGTIEHTSGVSTTQFIDKTALKILRTIAPQDQAHFWITLGGTTVTWKSTFNAADPEELTDKEVLSWEMKQDYQKMFNSVTVRGIRIGDEQLESTQSDATSIALYNATRSMTHSGHGIVSEAECSSKATALLNRYKDIQKIVKCRIRGNTATAAHANTIKLGDEVTVNSTYLGVNAVYIVQQFSYDSTNHVTSLLLHPRLSQTGLQEDLTTKSGEEMMKDVQRGTADTYIPSPSEDTIT